MTDYTEKFLDRVFNSVADPFAIYNHDFRILKVNQALMTLFKLSADQLIGKYCYKVFYHRTTICQECHVKEVFDTGKPQMQVKHIPTPDGNKRIFEVHSCPITDRRGVTIQAVEYIRDITERETLENQLRGSKELNDIIINSILENLILVDSKTYRIIQANNSFHARVGLEPPDAAGKLCHEVILNSPIPCKEAGLRCPVEETVRKNGPTRLDKIYPDAAGVDRILEVSTYPILNAQGEISSIVRLERDVTEKRKMEQALAFRSKELQRTQHQLETLFETSRQVNAKNTLIELVDFIHQIGQQIFSDSEFLFFLLEAGNQNFLDLEGCNSSVVESLHRMKQKLDLPRNASSFIQYLQNIREPHIIGSEYSNNTPHFLSRISESYQSWFGLPISSPQQCIGYFVLGSPFAREDSREDMQFFLTLFSQVAGHIRHLIIHESEINLLQQRVTEQTSHGKIIGRSNAMQKIYELIDLVASSDATVLITGENGTGKELVAQAIHRQSHRKNGPFVVANCSAYSPTLLESELFGHEKGAFTGAIKRKIGRIERAQGGILFLDEIGDTSPATQVLLLRFLQDHCFERVGGEETIEIDVRVLAATNRDLYREVETSRFRDDLYYRLNVITIELPPLRDRKEDIPILCNHFLQKYRLKEEKKIQAFSPDAMQALMDHDWPGNVRQLGNAVSHAVILVQGQVIERRHLPQFLKQSAPEPSVTSLVENERRLILGALQESNWNKHEASRRLEISRSTLYSKIRRYSLEKGTHSV
ncbi:MAG: sigma 54-interacting transcriptional regulator [Pseudomonadota bacterium]